VLPDTATAGSLGARLELLKRAGRIIDSVVDGSSMEPAIARGTRIRIRAQTELPPDGTVVAVLAPGGVVTHRLVCRGRLPWNQRFVLTQGDGAMLCDPPANVGLLVGPVTMWSVGGDYCDIPERSRSARAMQWRAWLWRVLVRTAFVIHPVAANLLVRWSLRGRVEPVQWPS